MADNTVIPAGAGGDTIRDIDRGVGSKTQVVALDAGGPAGGPESIVSVASPLPVIEANNTASQSSDSPQFVAITGDPSGDFAGVNILEKLVDDSGDLKMAVSLKDGVLIDAKKAIVLSDGIQFNSSVTAIYDCTGYGSFSLQAIGGSGNIALSADGVNFIAAISTSTTGGQFQNGGFNAGAIAHGPVVVRYMRVTSTSSYILTLKQAPYSPFFPFLNLSFISGSTVASTGIAGAMPVAGVTSVGANPTTADPVIVASVDPGTLARRVLSDTSGRLLLAAQTQPGATPSLSTAPISVLPATQSPQNATVLPTADGSQVDGVSWVELLAQILVELQINNQLLYELPRILQGSQVQFPEGPEVYRADPTIFAQ